MRTKSEEFTLPTWILCYIFNGDFSGLSDDELEKADELEKTAQKICDERGASHWNFSIESDDEPEFSTHNDVDGWIGGDVQTVSLVLFFEEKGKYGKSNV